MGTTTTISKLQKALAVFAAVFLLSCIGCLKCGDAWADSGDALAVDALPGKHFYCIVNGNKPTITYADYDGGGTISKAKSSNTKVVSLKLEKRKGYKQNFLTLCVKKPGTATVTYRLKGKQYTAKIVARKYSNPLKSLKIGGKEYASKFKGSVSANVNSEKLFGKVKVKPASGWKLKAIQLSAGGPFKKVPNGGTIKKRKYSDNLIRLVLVEKATGFKQELLI